MYGPTPTGALHTILSRSLVPKLLHPKNTAPSLEDLLARMSVCDDDVFSHVRQLVVIGAASPIGSREA